MTSDSLDTQTGLVITYICYIFIVEYKEKDFWKMTGQEETASLISSSRLDYQTTDHVNGAREVLDEGLEFVAEQASVAVFENAMANDQSEEEDDTVEVGWTRAMRTRHQDLSFYQRPSMLVLCTLLVLLCVTESLCFTPAIALTMKKICDGLLEVNDAAADLAKRECDPKKVQAIMSGITSLLSISTGLIGTFMSAKWGELSDRIGRVRVFGYIAFIKIFGNAIQLYALSPAVRYHKWGIILGLSISPFSGGILAAVAIGNSYVADIMESEHRALSMSIMMSAIYASIGLGPMLSGILINMFNGNNAAPIYFSLLTGSLSAILCLTAIHEPRHEDALKLSHTHFMERKDSLSSSKPNVKVAATLFSRTREYLRFCSLQAIDVLSPVKILWLKPTASGSLIPRYTVVLLLIIDVLFLCMTSASMSTIVLYATYKFDWRAVKLGYFISISGLGKAAVLMLLSPAMLYALKKHYRSLNNSIDQIDVFCIRLSMVLLTLSTLIVLLDNENESSLFVLAVLHALSAFCSPTLQSSIIKYCSKKFTGQCFGGMALIRSAVMLALPPVFLMIYGSTVSFRPEIFLYVISACGVLAIALTFFLRIVEDNNVLRRPSEVALNAPGRQDVSQVASRRASTAQSLRQNR